MDASASTKAKRDNFKKGISQEDNRRRREEVSIKLRKEKKEESFAKRRNICAPVAPVEGGAAEPAPVSAEAGSLQALFQGLHSQSIEEVIRCVRGFRKLLSVEQNPPVRECVALGVLPIFVACLYKQESTELQFEAAWALTNIASTDYTRAVVENNAVPPLVQLLASHSPDIREQCAWCLGNIAGDAADMRDIVLANNPLPALLANIANPASLSLLRNCAWTLSNFCRGKPGPRFETVSAALPALATLINANMDQDVAVDAAWALSYLSDGSEDRIQAVIDAQVAPRLVEMLVAGGSLLVPALRTLGNFVTGSEAQTQVAIDAGLLTALVPLLSHNRKNVRKEVCWVLSNVAAGSSSQLKQLVEQKNMLAKVLQQMGSSIEWDVRKEAAWVISNVATSAPRDIIVRLVELGAVNHLCELLEVDDSKVILIALDAVEAILKVGEQIGDGTAFMQLVTDCGGADTLERLQEHESPKVYKRVVEIIERFFGAEEEGECSGENIAPATDGNTFSFGLPAASTSKDFNFGAKNAPSSFNFGVMPPQAPQPVHTHFSFA